MFGLLFERKRDAIDLLPPPKEVVEEVLVKEIVEESILTKPIIKKESPIIDSKYIQGEMDKEISSSTRDIQSRLKKDIENLELKRKQFLKDNESIIEKSRKLDDLGFVQSPTLNLRKKELDTETKNIEKNIKTISDKVKKNKQIIQHHNEYAIKYPSYKFIDKDSMVKVMKQYGLILGDVCMYAKEVPERALDIICRFEKEIKESETYKFIVCVYKGIRLSVSLMRYETFSYNSKKELERFLKEKTDKHMKEFKDGYMDTLIEGQHKVSKLKIVAPKSHFNVHTVRIDGENIPVADIDENNFLNIDVKKANKVLKNKRKVLDPIACLKVEGGFIILDAWDKEAEIPEVKNEILN